MESFDDDRDLVALDREFLHHKSGYSDVLERCLPGVVVVAVDIPRLILTISTTASGKQIFDAEAALRRATGIKFELMCGRLPDANKLRVKLAKFRGIGDAA